MKKKFIFSFSGKTTDEKIVVNGVFTLVGTHGIPLEIVLEELKSKSIIIDWCDYVEASLKDGANLTTIKSRIDAAIGDVYGPVYKKLFMGEINDFFP